jgi:AcrR family transcriptional regulator
VQSGRLATEKERLCRALTSVVDERGWTGASPGLVAREAGLTTNEFYDQFRSLEHCYIAVYEWMLARVSRLAQHALADRTLAPGHAAWREQLDAVLGSVLWFFALEPALARICLVEVLNAGAEARARRDEALDRFASFVEGLRLTHGQPMPPVAAEVIVLGTTKLIYTRVARGEAESLPSLLPELRELWATTVTEHVEPDSALALG